VNVNKSVIAMAKGPRYLAALLGHPPLTQLTLDALCVVCRDHVECRDAFPPQGMMVIAKVLQSAANMTLVGPGHTMGKDGMVAFESAEDAAALATACCNAVVALATRTEDNKQGFVKKESGGLKALLAAIKAHSNDKNLVTAACLALKTGVTFDDLRRDFAGAYGACVRRYY
jgi:hypothetical protein